MFTLWVMGVVIRYWATGGFEETRDPIDVEDVEMGEGLVDEHEAARLVLLHHQPNQENKRLHHLLAAGGLPSFKPTTPFWSKLNPTTSPACANTRSSFSKCGGSQCTSIPAKSPSCRMFLP